MTGIACIVEGHGEVASVPNLLRRIAEWRPPKVYPLISVPIRVPRDRFLNREEEFVRYLKLAELKAGKDGWILILLDADDDCPALCGAEILARAKGIVLNQRVSVVLANREFEAWFIGAAESLRGVRGLEVTEADLIQPAETPRDAKNWLATRMGGRGYGSTTDQPAFVAHMDLSQAHRQCRSFRKLCAEWDRYVG